MQIPNVCHTIFDVSVKIRLHCCDSRCVWTSIFAVSVRGSIIGCFFIIAAALAQAEDPLATKESASRPYEGVAPGSANTPPRVQQAKSASALLLTWPGFQMLPSGESRFFVQTNREVAIESRAGSGSFRVVLKGVKVPVRNNRSPLVTRFFNTPVNRARVERRGRDAVFVLELRAEAVPQVTTEPGKDGFFFVFVTFPAGQYLPAKPATDSTAPPASAPPTPPQT
jgi:hypothetical protein